IKPVNASVMFNTIMEVFDKDVDRGPRIRAKQESEKDTLKTIKGASVLLVEDNEINQQVAREILSDAGLEVTLANDGQEAVDAVQQNKFDAVLMDIQMPVMDGYTATREIRNLKSEIRNVPVIAMTAHAMTGDREKSIQAGMNDHVAKPIDPEALFTTLLKWIQRPADRENDQLPETETSKSSKVEDSDRSPLPFQADGNDDLPPSLAGFDLAAGLKRLQGNRRLYRKLLLDFANGYREASENIHHALIANDINQVHSLVHNIKGLAGNLSATDLQNAAAEMDSSVKKALSGEKLMPGQLESNLSAVKKALEEALASCQTLERSNNKKAGVTSGGSSVSMPPDLARQTAGQLLAAVDMGDITDLKSIAEALKSKSESYTAFSEKITHLAENFDFDGIKQLADELESHK
ncbi:MAG: response regulator, partial [Proteobacteria bacterium]|nr:response regulator [Pseudomonadota bacterium]